MTLDELHDAIFGDAQAKALADAGNDAGCAVRLSALLPPTVHPRLVDASNLLAAFPNPADGLAFYNALVTVSAGNPVLTLALQWLNAGTPGLDVGSPAVRAMLDQLVTANVHADITAGRVPVVKALAEVPTTIDHGQVSDAWLRYRPGGIVGGQTQ